ncbi:MAG TPA: integrase, partial [Verrucomicrobia bacterium]|nr:integrase [Verrucomicrobiota bacterium]
MPQIVSEAGSVAQKRFLEFFAVTIRNRNTRIAYAQAIAQFFEWCEFKGITALNQI